MDCCYCSLKTISEEGLEMREISLVEAAAVGGANGALIAGAAIGGAAAAAGYIGTSVGGGTFNTREFVGTTVIGAIGGVFTGPTGAVSTNIIKGVGIGYGAGVIGGGISRQMQGA